MNLFNNGTLTTDDLSMIQGGTPAAAPAAFRSSTASAAAAPVFQTAALAAPPTTGPKKNKGDKITTHNTVPAPDGGKPDKSGRDPKQGHQPGAVVLPPFVVSPELTRG